MLYEVEEKFPVSDRQSVLKQLKELGFEFGAPVQQVDNYFAHPSRDFVQTDEALRIRQVGAKNVITYKGPRIDDTSNTRQELEIPFESGEATASEFSQLLTNLGFVMAGAVRKQRATMKLIWRQRQFEIAFDDVEDLGTFIEIESLADEEELDEVQESLASLAAELGLQNADRRSYFELVMDKQSKSA